MALKALHGTAIRNDRIRDIKRGWEVVDKEQKIATGNSPEYKDGRLLAFANHFRPELALELGDMAKDSVNSAFSAQLSAIEARITDVEEDINVINSNTKVVSEHMAALGQKRQQPDNATETTTGSSVGSSLSGSDAASLQAITEQSARLEARMANTGGPRNGSRGGGRSGGRNGGNNNGGRTGGNNNGGGSGNGSKFDMVFYQPPTATNSYVMQDDEKYYTKTINNPSLGNIPEERHWCPRYDTNRPADKTGKWVLLRKDWKGTFVFPRASN